MAQKGCGAGIHRVHVDNGNSPLSLGGSHYDINWEGADDCQRTGGPFGMEDCNDCSKGDKSRSIIWKRLREELYPPAKNPYNRLQLQRFKPEPPSDNKVAEFPDIRADNNI